MDTGCSQYPSIHSRGNIDKYIFSVDSIITALLPDRNIDPELFELVPTHQVYFHSKSCHTNMTYTNTKMTYVVIILARFSPIEQSLQFQCKVIV